MAQFDRVTTMRITNEDRVCLIYGQVILEQIVEKMDNESADYIESLETGEMIEYDEFRIALRVFGSLLDEKTGRSWKLV